MRSRNGTGRAARRGQLKAEKLLAPRSQLGQLRYVPRTLRLVWAAASGWTLASTLLLVIQGFLPIFTVYLTRSVINALVAVIDSQGDSATLQSALLPMLLMGGVLLTSQILTSLQAYVGTLLAERTQDYMNDLIHDKAITLDLQYYESPVYFDQMQRASTDAIDRPLSLLINLNSLLQNSITLVAMGGVLFTFVWWMPLLLLAGTAPTLWVALRTTVAFHRWRLTNTMNQRRLHYYHNNLVTERPAAEIRIFGLGEHFKRAYNQLPRKAAGRAAFSGEGADGGADRRWPGWSPHSGFGAGLDGLERLGRSFQFGRPSDVLAGDESGPAVDAQFVGRRGGYLSQPALSGRLVRFSRFAAHPR